jgi:L-fuculose-phosphate aldolase
MDEFLPDGRDAGEEALRRDIAAMIHRACRQRLFFSALGTYSARLSDGSFLITPHGMDRAYIGAEDLVLVKDGVKEQGKTPSRSVDLHRHIYRRHPYVRSIIGANPPYSMAYAVTDAPFNPRIIPESHIVLRQVQKIPFTAACQNHDAIADKLSELTPVLICENSRILVTGSSPLHAFDRLEVMEATARTIIAAHSLGDPFQIDAVFGLK